jgi:DNA-binding transcriptional ArsR family regulator
MVTVFEVVGAPRRREVLEQLLVGDRSVGALTEALGLSQPSVSKHLRVLREAGLVSVRVDAQRRVYRLRPEPLKELDSWLAPYRRIWDERLDALERRLDEMED